MFAIGLENLFGGLFDPSRPRYDIAIGGILVGMVISYFVHRTPHQQVTLRELFHRLRRTR